MLPDLLDGHGGRDKEKSRRLKRQEEEKPRINTENTKGGAQRSQRREAGLETGSASSRPYKVKEKGTMYRAPAEALEGAI